MALIVEDGTVVTGATVYLNIAEADELVAEYGLSTDWLDASTFDKELNLRKGTREFDESLSWASSLVDPTQPRAFPRKEFTDLRGRSIVGIPVEIKVASLKFAIEMIKGTFSKDKPTKLTSQTFGDSAEFYATPVTEERSVYHDVLIDLKKLGFGNSATTIVTFDRA